jgi:hypothetical protein
MDYGHGQSYEVFMTTDGGRRWALRGRFPWAEVQGIFFLSPSTGFIETDEGAASDDDPAQIYSTSDGGKHWREAWGPPPPMAPGGSAPSARQWDFGDKTGVSFASPRVGFVTLYSFVPEATLQRTSDEGRTWYRMVIASGHGEGGVTLPPVFSSPEVGSMAVVVGPTVRRWAGPTRETSTAHQTPDRPSYGERPTAVCTGRHILWAPHEPSLASPSHTRNALAGRALPECTVTTGA